VQIVRIIGLGVLVLGLSAVLAYWWWAPMPIDDGDHRTPADFPELEVDVFQLMDGGIALEPDEIKVPKHVESVGRR